MRHRPEANHQQPYINSRRQKSDRQSEQSGVFSEKQIKSYDRLEYARRITDRHHALKAGLPDPEHVESAYKDLGDETLPIYGKRRELMNMVRDNRVSIVSGETGSGKTSQLYQYLLGEGYALVVVIVPRIAIANNVYDYAVDQLKQQRGQEFADSTVGVIHSERVIKNDDTKVLFMTAGTYVKMYADIQKRYRDQPVAVIGDEIHESNIQVELAVAMTAQSLPDNDKFRLILSSATQNEENIQNTMTPVNGGPVPRVDVEGRPYEMTSIEEPDMRLIEAFLKYRKNDQDELRERILMFKAGKREIADALDEAYDALTDLEKTGDGKASELIAMMLHAKITYVAFEAIMRDVPQGKQMLVAATSAAQSGITIPHTSVVLTDGLVKRNELDAEGTPGLMLRDASQAELTQQGGRAGRDIDGGISVLTKSESPTGEAYFLPFEEREMYPPAEIYHTNISRNVLAVSGYGLEASNVDFSVLNPFLLHSVEERTIVEAKEALYRLGALDKNDVITDLGRTMDMFPLRPELSRGLVEAMKENHSLQTIANVAAIAASLEAGGLAYFELGAGEEWRKAIRESTVDDCIAQLDMFYATREYYFGHSVDEEELLRQDFDPKNTYRAHRQWDKIMRSMNISPYDLHLLPPSAEDEEDIRNLMLAGMIDYVYEKTGTEGRDNVPLYGSIYRDKLWTDRTISSRTVMESEESKYIVGFPRRYPIVSRKREKIDGEKKPVIRKVVEIKHIVENGWPLSSAGQRKLAEYAAHLTVDHKSNPMLDKDGRLVESIEKRIGTIKIDTYTGRPQGDTSAEGQVLLVEQSLDRRDNDVQRVLNQLLFELNDLKERVVPSDIPHYFINTDIPNKSTLRAWIQEAATTSRSVGEVNATLRGRIYRENGLRRETWISDDKMALLSDRSPSRIQGKDNVSFSLVYEKGVPIVNRMQLDAIDSLPQPCELPDGRPLMFRVVDDSDARRGSQLYTFEDIHTMRYSTNG